MVLKSKLAVYYETMMSNVNVDSGSVQFYVCIHLT